MDCKSDGVKDGAGDGTKDGTGDGTGDGAKDGTGDAEAGISDKSLPDQTAALDTAAGTDFISSGEAGAGTDSSTATCPSAEGGCDCSLGPNGGSGQGFLFMLGFTLLALLRTVARRRRR